MSFFCIAEREAARRKIRIAVEIHHNTIFASASLVHRLVSNFDPAVIGVIYDVGNMVYEGYEDHRIGMDLLGPYLHHVHLKNAAAFPDELRANGIQKWRNRWTPLDEGLVNVKDFLLALEAGGYNGWISLEDLSTERDPLSTLKYNAGVLNALGRPAGGTHRQLTDRIGEETRFGTSTAPLFHGFSGARAFR